MRKYVLISTLTILILAACNLPTGVAVSPAAPTVTTLPAQAPAHAGNPSTLTGTTWTWIGLTSPNEQVAVESPLNYSLLFQADGTVNITADCNNGQGSYQVDGQSIQIQVGTMTKAMCPPGSRSVEFIQLLSGAASYSLQDGRLFIDLAADGGTMVFATSQTAGADQQDGAQREALQANPWQWVSFASPAGQYDIENPANYQLTFHGNGTVDIKADCNNASGTYAIDGVRISIQIGPVTLAACPAGSRSEEFIRDLGNVAIFIYQPGELFLNLAAEGGTMRLMPVITGN